MWFLIPLFALTIAAAVVFGRRRRKRDASEHDEKRSAQLLDLLGSRTSADDTVGEPMAIDGFTGRERVVCVRTRDADVTIYETRKARRYGFIVYLKDGRKHESREYGSDTSEGRLLASWFSPPPPALDPKVPGTDAVPGTSEAPPDPPVDPFSNLHDSPAEASSPIAPATGD